MGLRVERKLYLFVGFLVGAAGKKTAEGTIEGVAVARLVLDPNFDGRDPGSVGIIDGIAVSGGVGLK